MDSYFCLQYRQEKIGTDSCMIAGGKTALHLCTSLSSSCSLLTSCSISSFSLSSNSSRSTTSRPTIHSPSSETTWRPSRKFGKSTQCGIDAWRSKKSIYLRSSWNSRHLWACSQEQKRAMWRKRCSKWELRRIMALYTSTSCYIGWWGNSTAHSSWTRRCPWLSWLRSLSSSNSDRRQKVNWRRLIHKAATLYKHSTETKSTPSSLRCSSESALMPGTILPWRSCTETEWLISLVQFTPKSSSRRILKRATL